MTRDLRRCPALAAAGLAAICSLARAETYPLVDGEDLVGEQTLLPVTAEQTLLDIALEQGVGFRQLLLANPGVDAWLPTPRQPLLLPKRVVLPRGIRDGLVINVAEMRLYYFPPPLAEGRRSVMVFPISVGRDNWKTPLGVTRVRERAVNPVWRTTENIRAEHLADGDPLPAEVPPGPDNPLGPLALRLDLPQVLIHGSHRPYGIGMPVTHGCVRLAAGHMRELFDQISVGTPVIFIDEPYKLGRSQDRWFLEVHPLHSEDSADTQDSGALDRIRSLVQQAQIPEVDWKTIEQALKPPRGVPVAITAFSALEETENPPSGHRTP